MQIIEMVLLFLYVVVAFYSTYTDFKQGTVKNKFLLISFLLALVLDAVYYYLNSDFIKCFGVNQVIVFVVSFLLFKIGVWGGGDGKLLMCLSLIYPARFYIYEIENSPFIYVLILSFSISFVYLAIDSIINLLKGKNNIRTIDFKDCINFEAIKNMVIVFMFFYIFDYTLCTIFNLLKFNDVYLIIQFLNIAVVMYCNFRFINNEKMVFCISFIFFLLILISMKYVNYEFNILNVLLITFIMIAKSVAGQFNYTKIKSDELTKGMILSKYSTMLMIPSKIKNLPTSINEDMNSRLTLEEVEACKKWSNSKKGKDEFIIVRKMPFAAFISISSIIYMILGVLVAL